MRDHSWRVKGFETLRDDPRGHVNRVTRVCETCPAELVQDEVGYISGGSFRVEPVRGKE